MKISVIVFAFSCASLFAFEYRPSKATYFQHIASPALHLSSSFSEGERYEYTLLEEHPFSLSSQTLTSLKWTLPFSSKMNNLDPFSFLAIDVKPIRIPDALPNFCPKEENSFSQWLLAISKCNLHNILNSSTLVKLKIAYKQSFPINQDSLFGNFDSKRIYVSSDYKFQTTHYLAPQLTTQLPNMTRKNYVVDYHSFAALTPTAVSNEGYFEELSSSHESIPFCMPPYQHFAEGRVLFEEPTMTLSGQHTESYYFYQDDYAKRLNRTHRLTKYQLTLLPTLTDLETDSLGDNFYLEARTYPLANEEGYIFTLQLRPSEPAQFNPISEHIYFLIDRNAGIEKHRLEVFKNGVIASLRYLPETASFNVLLLDEKQEFISKEELRVCKSSTEFVKKALQNTPHGKNTDFANLYTFLEVIKNKARNSQDIYTVVLLSNGYLMKNIRIHRNALYGFIKDKPPNLNVHTAAISDKNNIPMLELLANLGGGHFLFSQIHTSFPRKFASFMKRHSRPFANNIEIHPISNNVQFAHNADVPPIFYVNKPYTFYGKIDTLTDLDFIIQGTRGSRFINIRKRINLRDALTGKDTYAHDFLKKQAQSAMIRFINTSDPQALLEAKQLLAPYATPLPFN